MPAARTFPHLAVGSAHCIFMLTGTDKQALGIFWAVVLCSDNAVTKLDYPGIFIPLKQPAASGISKNLQQLLLNKS